VVEMALMLLLPSASDYVNEAILNNKQVAWQAWLGIRRSHFQIQIQSSMTKPTVYPAILEPHGP
jgi:hypothetical protein